ncbi:alpha/beta-hydrolase [Echria macrotheca]|uniref:Alpha/beta-hydrolase n=1 Tax=Echria macrotheca TaxID=438768 RepID=A0AAJ0BLQ0_9PEZI|nr:alpha/beta-hydrolase [Echria macrotheca]
MASSFHIKEHTVEAQHIREYPHATAHSQEEVLYLAVKQYTPKNNPTPKHGDVTIIASHANGFVKELYEPLWEDLLGQLNQRGINVRGIWIADVAWQGQSGIINEANLGNDPFWHDHSRDLLHMINHFRRSMPRPLIGIGHSFGANIIVNLSLLHPRLLSSLVLLDPVLGRFKHRPSYGLTPMANSARRRDLWPSRESASSSFARAPFYSTWDPRVLALWNQHGLRDTPTPLYPSAAPPQVTLTTSKHMECFTYYRPLAQAVNPATNERIVDKTLLVDADADTLALDPKVFPFYRAEGSLPVERLPTLRPGACYIFGETSDVNPPDVRREKMELTGVGTGGSGGARAGRVRQTVIKGFGHLVPMEATTRCAEVAAEFIADDLKFWKEEDREFREVWAVKSIEEKQRMDENWWRWLGGKERPKGKL